MIKKAILLFIAIFFVACSNFAPRQSGNVSLTKGDGEKVKVKYEIARQQYDFFTTVIKTNAELQSIAEQASLEAKMKCKFMPTYEPQSITFMASGDTITTFVNYNAKNAFGTSAAEMLISKFKGTSFIENL